MVSDFCITLAKLNKSRFEANRGAPGAALLAEGAYPTLVMTEPEVISNVAELYPGSQYGGGVSCWGTVYVSGGRFENNVGEGLWGGGLYGIFAFITDTQFISNSSILGCG